MGKVSVVVGFVLLVVTCASIAPDEKAIILPEEIHQAQKGDTLIVIASKEGIIELGFKH